MQQDIFLNQAECSTGSDRKRFEEMNFINEITIVVFGWLIEGEACGVAMTSVF